MIFFAWRLIIINTFLYKIWFFHTLPSEASTLWFILILLFLFLINIFFWTFISVLDKTTYSEFLYTFYCFISYLAQGPAVIQRRIVLPLGRAGNPIPPLLLCAQWLQPYQTLCDPMDCSGQAPLSMGFSRQEYWRGLPFPPPGDLPKPLNFLCLLPCRWDSLPLSYQGSHSNIKEIWEWSGKGRLKS